MWLNWCRTWRFLCCIIAVHTIGVVGHQRGVIGASFGISRYLVHFDLLGLGGLWVPSTSVVYITFLCFAVVYPAVGLVYCWRYRHCTIPYSTPYASFYCSSYQFQWILIIPRLATLFDPWICNTLQHYYCFALKIV